MTVRVVLVDDHEIVRLGVLGMLAREPDIDVVGTASSAEEGEHVITATRPDVAVLDHQLPGMTGVELCERLQAQGAHVGVILLTTFLSDDVVRSALEAGVRGYLGKDVASTRLVSAIRAVARGEVALDEKVAGRVARWASRRHVSGFATLAERERDVLAEVAKGATNRAIAATLHISENTVRTYIRRILDKLECATRAEAVAVATKRGLL